MVDLNKNGELREIYLLAKCVFEVFCEFCFGTFYKISEALLKKIKNRSLRGNLEG